MRENRASNQTNSCIFAKRTGTEVRANKLRTMELQTGRPQQKGNRHEPAYAHNVKALREQEMQIARQAEQRYERFVAARRPRPPRDRCADASTGKA